MLRRSVFVFVAFLVGAAHASIHAQRRALVVPRRRQHSSSRPLQIRGGAIISKKSVAQVATTVSLLQGAAAWLNQNSWLQSYGIDATASIKIAQHITRLLGMVLLQMGVIGICLFFTDSSVQAALAAASFCTSIEMLRGLLLASNHMPPSLMQLVILTQSLIVYYTNLDKMKCASIVNKVNAAMCMLVALAMSFTPEWILEVALGATAVDAKTIGMMAGLGYWCIAYAVYIGGLAFDVPVFSALIWNRLCILMIHFLPSKGESIGMSSSKKMGLLVYQALVLIGLLLQDGVRCLVRCSV